MISVDGLRRVVCVTAELRYLPNKLHGDELVSRDGRVYTEFHDEWLDAGEIDDFLAVNPDPPLLLVDRNEGMPVLYEFGSPARKIWESTIRPLYISADGYPPKDLAYCLAGYVWADPDGRKLLVFELEC